MYYGFPVFDEADMYAYFQSLNDIKHNQPKVAWAKKKLYNDVWDYTTGIITTNFGDNSNKFIELEKVRQALDFLYQVAKNEHQKELNILYTYKNELQKKLPKNKDIQEILNRIEKSYKMGFQEKMGNNDLYNAYYDLITCINILRQSAIEYKERLEEIRARVRDQEKTTMGSLMSDDYRMRGYGDIQALFNNLIGRATKLQDQKATAFSKIMREKVVSYMIKHGLQKKITSGEDFLAIAAALMMDIEREIEKEMKHNTAYTDFAQFEEKEIQDIIDKYEEREGEDQTRLQKALAGDIQKYSAIVTAAKKTLGITRLTGEELKTQISRTKGRVDRLGTVSLYKKLKKEGASKSLLEDLQTLSFTSSTQTTHGNLFELIKVLIDDSIKVKGNPATDIMSLHLTLDQTPYEEMIRKRVDSISTQFTKFSTETRKSRKDELTGTFTEMNDSISTDLKSLDDYIDKLEQPIENIFIFHESLKLYSTLETRGDIVFTGRTLTILTFLDEMYSFSDMLEMPDREVFNFLATNLFSQSIVSQLGIRIYIEEYFSIFAGLLMFDDVRNIALEAQNELSYGHINNIHLYYINGIYVPASLVLKETARILEYGLAFIDSDLATNAKIITKEADAKVSKWLNENTPYKKENGKSFRHEWAPMGESVASGTKVSIKIVGAYMHLIRNLIEKIGG